MHGKHNSMGAMQNIQGSGLQGTCVGIPPPGVQISIRMLALNTQQASSTDDIGEVLTRGPHTMMGYIGQEAQPFLEHGWLQTGDLGWIDGQGRLWLVGRLKVATRLVGLSCGPAAVCLDSQRS